MNITDLTEALKTARPLDVFGARTEAGFKQMAKICHPDNGGTDEAFIEVMRLYDEWEDIDNENAFNVDGVDYVIIEKLFTDEVATTYLVGGLDGNCLLKRALNDDTLAEFQHEVDVIAHLYATSGDLESELIRFVPKPIAIEGDTAVYSLPEFVDGEECDNLENIAIAHNFRIQDRAIGWLWRRVFTATNLVNSLGVVHGDLTPTSIIVFPEPHHAFLMGFYHASVDQEVVKAYTPRWKGHYPPEAVLKQPPTPAWDIFMGATAMKWASCEMPRPMMDYFMAMTAPNPLGREYTLAEMNTLWEDVMYGRLNWRKEFVPFPFKFSSVDWEAVRNGTIAVTNP